MTMLSTTKLGLLFGALNFPIAESLCIELLACLQSCLPEKGKQLKFGILSGDYASVYFSAPGRPAVVLWLNLDQVRDWFYAKYSRDSQLTQEIEQELLEDFGAQAARYRPKYFTNSLPPRHI